MALITKFTDEQMMMLVRELEKMSANASMAGGKASSSCLQSALRLKKADVPGKYTERLDKMIDIWREMLKVHNEKPYQVHQYDLETGFRIGGKF